MSVYKVIELIGTSKTSWEKATEKAINKARGTLHDLRVAEVIKLDVRLDDNGQIVEYRAKVSVSFKYDD